MTFKKILTATLSLVLLTGFMISTGMNEVSTYRGAADTNERNRTYAFADLTGTLPTSTTYVDLNATTNSCGFVITGNAQRSGTSPKFALGITNDRTPEARIIITVPGYVIGLTGIEIHAYSASSKLRYLAINGTPDDTGINTAGTWDSPISTGKIPVTGSSVIITSPNGNILVKSFTVFYT